MNSNSMNRSSRGAKSLPAEFVCSEEIFELERRNLFNTHWQCVAHQSQLDSQSGMFTADFGNANYLFVRDFENSNIVRCFHNVCRHRGSLLVDEQSCGITVSQRIQCPYHAWTYDRTGNLVAAPNMTEVDGFCKEKFGLKPVRCEQAFGYLWIQLDESGPDFDEFFEPFRERIDPWRMDFLTIGSAIQYSVKANWKLIFQNYSECYHCPSVHPALNRLTPYKGASNDLSDGPILGGPMSLADECETMSSDGRFIARALPGLNERQSRSVAYYTICPTAFISPHPDYVLVHRVYPVATDETKVICDFLFEPNLINEPGFDPSRAVEFWDETNLQDWYVCELTQRGMTTDGYEPGPYSNLESVLAAFDRYYFEQFES